MILYMFKNFIETFVTMVSLHPNKPAIIFHKTVISYEELNQCTNDLALHLINIGISPEEIVPLILERGTDTIIAMIAILKIGCAFLPISPITPCSRIKFILEDTKARIVISNINLAFEISPQIKVVNPAEIKSSNNSVATVINRKNLAYVMYTSGSTGNPKGVLIEHGSMMNLFSSLISELNITEDEKFLALTDYTFDISLIELLMPLLQGATILLTEQGTVADGVKIRGYLENNAITFMQATPLTWEILLKQGWKNPGNIKILVGGEKFRTRLAELLDYNRGNVWNMYGPTETSMWSMFNNLDTVLATESVPLGKPLKNTNIEILDDTLQTVPFGCQGELYIGGEGLARGYLNNQELTEDKFIYHPQTKTRLYKTGDLVAIFDPQTLCYVGRADDQLKFGGIRVEAGEIESVIEQEPFVKKAVVKIHETEGYYKSLAAYIEVDEEKIFSHDVQTTTSDVPNFLKSIYDEIYLHAEDHEHETINNCGWQNSFTGQLFSIEELNKSYQFIRKIIKDADLSDVLEVGCGTGSLLAEYINEAIECTLVEISSNAIDYVKTRLNSKQLQKIIFRNESVLNVHDHQKYSCIIINSVIQYLPSIHSLITCLTQLVKATKSGGTIIIGDVRSLELLDIYLLEKMRVNSKSKNDFHLNLSSFYYKSRDTEIVLSPKFFYALKNIIKEISQVDISVKHGKYQNELNYFRYDVILHIDKPVHYQPLTTIQYIPSLTNKTVQQIINSNPNDSISIRSIPNIYIQSLLQAFDSEVLLSLIGQEVCFSDETRVQIGSLIDLETESHEKFITYDETDPINTITIRLYPKASSHKLIRSLDLNEYENYRAYCREPFNPWLQKFCFDHIRLKISQHVVSWVNPSVYVWIEKWPVSINGKLDKKKLSLPVNIENSSPEKGILEQLQNMWRNITGDNALIDKEFWVHGVSSLCMYFFLATINETFLVNINYHEFRDYNTLDKLANYINQLLDLSSIKEIRDETNNYS